MLYINLGHAPFLVRTVGTFSTCDQWKFAEKLLILY